MSEKVFGCACNGTGVDPDFQDACKCTQVEGVSEKQAKFVGDLVQQITAIIKVDLNWANVTTKAEASKVIDLLKAIKAMAFILKAKRSKVTADQIEAIRAKINNKPTTEWVQKATKKLVTL